MEGLQRVCTIELQLLVVGISRLHKEVEAGNRCSRERLIIELDPALRFHDLANHPAQADIRQFVDLRVRYGGSSDVWCPRTSEPLDSDMEQIT
jgi:hypothetical protein